MARLQFTPKLEQRPMIAHAFRNPRCALFASMGIGKTVAVLTVLDALKLIGDYRPALIPSPLNVARNTWPAEARKWEHLRDFKVSAIVGDHDERLHALRRRADAYTINYENIPWLFEQLEKLNWGFPFGAVVPDESTRLKGMRASVQRAKKKDGSEGEEFIRAAGAVRARQLARVCRAVPRWINLTGTPAPNGLQDLWGQTWFLDQGQRLGRTYEAFEHRWFRRNEYSRQLEPLPYAQEQIEDAIRDICLTVRIEDYVDIDKPIVTKRFVDLPAKARRQYKEMEKEMFTRLDGFEVEAFNAAAKTMKCLQFANGAAYVDDEHNWREAHREKLDELRSVIEEAAGENILVAYHFVSDLARLKKAFPQGVHLSSKNSERVLEDWNAGKIPLLFAHPKSAGHGLNLQDGGRILVYFSVNWNLEEHQQIAERLGPARQMQAGHDRAVFHYYILARDTIDELVLARLETKRSVQDVLLEALRAQP